jgi:hypothetical protein
MRTASEKVNARKQRSEEHQTLNSYGDIEAAASVQLFE